ncbi:MAG: TolC family protein [Campylobacterota bacterium]|nr:TolC family protein [Campylobacterota bacterium]
MIKFKYIITFPLLVAINLNSSEDILSNSKNKILDYNYQKSIEDSEKLRNDWVNPITYRYTYNKNENYTTTKSSINISQPIFKSGGIYYAIKYASSVKNLSEISIENQRKELIKQTVNILFQINKININIEKQKLLIENSKIDIDRKKEQVLNGIIDTSFLDNAILDKNIKQNSLIDLEYQKELLVHNLSTLSDKTYDKFELPVLELLDKDEFLETNIYTKELQYDIDKSYWMKNMVISNYLPTVNFTADYSKYHNIDNNPALDEDWNYNIGFNISMPLDIRYSNSIQSAKISYLIEKTNLEDKKQSELVIYKNALSKIDSIDKKIKITEDNIKLYDSLLEQLIEQQEVGMKTQADVMTMVNSKQIKLLDMKTLYFDKQIELLEIYARVENE